MAVTARSASSLNMQFEHVAEKMFSHMTRTSEELNILNLVSKSLDGEHYRVNFQTEGNPYFAARGEREWLPGYDPDTGEFYRRLPAPAPARRETNAWVSGQLQRRQKVGQLQ